MNKNPVSQLLKNRYHTSHPTWQTQYTQCGPEKYMKPPGSLCYKHNVSTNNNKQQINLTAWFGLWLCSMSLCAVMMQCVV